MTTEATDRPTAGATKWRRTLWQDLLARTGRSAAWRRVAARAARTTNEVAHHEVAADRLVVPGDRPRRRQDVTVLENTSCRSGSTVLHLPAPRREPSARSQPLASCSRHVWLFAVAQHSGHLVNRRAHSTASGGGRDPRRSMLAAATHCRIRVVAVDNAMSPEYASAFISRLDVYAFRRPGARLAKIRRPALLALLTSGTPPKTCRRADHVAMCRR